MDFERLNDAQPLIILTALVLMFALESVRPLLEPATARWKHARRNLGLSLLAFVFFGAAGAAKAAVGAWTSAHSFGVLRWFALPFIPRLVISIFLMDFLDYLFHLVQHRSPWIWRFHRIHHSDSYVDATTSLRFHPIEGL